jgi:hypothetical protein
VRALAAWLVLLVALPGGFARADHPVEYRVLELGHTVFATDRMGSADLVIRNRRQWCEFVDWIYSGSSPGVPCDSFGIDFRREVVIAAALGPRPNGCYSVAITSVERRRRPRGLQVTFTEALPNPCPDTLCTQAFVFPVAALVVRKPTRRVEFLHERVMSPCGGRR